jgi:D-3-phosphoglycerate dehydrogenase
MADRISEIEKRIISKRIFLSHTRYMLAHYYGDRALAALRELGEVVLNDSDIVLDDPRALAQAAQGASIMVTDRQTPVPADFFAAVTGLQAVCRVAVDIRNIDVEAATRHGVLVTRATAGFIDSVCELAIGCMIDLGRGISNSVVRYRAGQPAAAGTGRQLRGATLGIIGYGAIGRRLAEIALALGMTVLVADPYQPIASPLHKRELTALLGEADFVVCLAIANEATENLMNEAAFRAMRADAFFVNLSRGNLVDESALTRALDESWIAGAAMDVGRGPDQTPSLALAIRPDVIATPHIGGLTPQAAEHQAFDTVRQVGQLLRGEIPPETVNPKG